MERKTDTELQSGQMEQGMKVNIGTMQKMEQELGFISVVASILETLQMVKSLDMECINGQMVTDMKENGEMIN